MSEQRFACYRVLDRIASGPVTEVFRAVQEPLERDVAIKSLKPSISPSSPFAVALAREARVLSSVRHENLPRVVDFVRSDDAMWLVMELVDGFTLRHLLEELDSLDPSAAVAISIELARALAHLHDRGLVHCDVRPSNVLISKDGRITLGDLSSAQAENLPSSPEPLDGETTLAPPTYMSPEQILGEAAEPRSDLFLLGIVMYEMLSGAKPFEARENRTVAHSIRHDEPPALDVGASTIPRKLAQTVATSLQKFPGDRYSSARELGGVLEEIYGKTTSLPRRHVIALALARARLIERPPPSDQESPEMLGPPPGRPSVIPAVRMLLFMLGLVVAGATLIHLLFRSDLDAQAASARGPLELVPTKAGSLRVIAKPWAHVLVDGQLVETTPFARPIPLAAGVHHVTLRHPNAPDERRVVRLASGERVLLDVTMRVKRPPAPSASARPAPSPSTP